MTNAHTPGPWHVIPTLTGALSINVTPKVPVATVGGAGWHLGEGVANANAALIAAAPDLLAALRRATPWLGKLIADGGHNNAVLPRDAEAALAMAEAAIAKAEGRS